MRHVVRILAVLLLLLASATAMPWVRSYWHGTVVLRTHTYYSGGATRVSNLGLEFSQGDLLVA
jgi:hypothetical protein